MMHDKHTVNRFSRRPASANPHCARDIRRSRDIATLALFSVAQPGGAEAAADPFAPQLVQTAPSTGSGGGRVIAVDDGGVNDNGQTSGDIFTQNAQDQSTA